MKKTLRRFSVLVLLWASIGCLTEPFTGSTVLIDFVGGMEPSALVRLPDGSSGHYELWAQFGDEGVLSLGRFIVTPEYHVNSYPDVDQRIGTVYNQSFDLQGSGVRFVTEFSLERVGSLFVTLEPNGETDIAPSGILIMEGPVAYDGEGLLRGELTGEYQTILGDTKLPVADVAIALAQDNVRL